MITDVIKDFINKTLTTKQLVKEMLSELGGWLYPYLLMLENTGRKSEAELIKKLREAIFEARDNDLITYERIASVLHDVRTRLDVQVTMLRCSEDKAWEAGFFNAYTNNLSGAIHYFAHAKEIEE